MGESSFYVDEAFSILVGQYPADEMSARNRRIAVMDYWDGRKFDGDPHRQMVAKMALCQIGLAWYDDLYPYPLDLVTGRLLEFMPELGAEVIEARTLRDIVGGRHASQYARSRGTTENI